MVMSVVNHRFFIWIILALPSFIFTSAILNGVQPDPTKSTYEFFTHPTGEFSARCMIIAMMLTPLRQLFPKVRFFSWLMQRRRYFGVAAFFYAVMHLVLYVLDTQTLDALISEAGQFGMWTGWVAFFIFVPLAITSNDVSVRKMGPGWKRLQQWVYLAAIGTLLHWMFIHNDFTPALVNFGPLILLETIRIARRFMPKAA
jgi:sulfoxide reductase heme-binding subunit YedZ